MHVLSNSVFKTNKDTLDTFFWNFKQFLKLLIRFQLCLYYTD